MDFWFKNNLRVSTVAAPAMLSCQASVAGNTVTVSGAATDAGGAISSYAVVLNGPVAVNDGAAGSGASFSKSYAVSDGYYSGSVSAFDAGTGRRSNPCPIAQFLVGSAPALPPPSGLTATSTTAGSVTLSWSAVSGASGYAVYRNGTKVSPSTLTASSYVDTGLAASTSYSYQVASLSAGGAESARSATVTAMTQSSFACTASNTSNYAHVLAGRAHDSGGYALANGSNQNMGLDNMFYTQTLAQTSPGYYVIGLCP
jgi:poly(3-hydroxybutyrate) depolymerase